MVADLSPPPPTAECHPGKMLAESFADVLAIKWERASV